MTMVNEPGSTVETLFGRRAAWVELRREILFTPAVSETVQPPPTTPDPFPDRAPLGILLAAWFALFHWLGNSTLGYVKTASLFGWLDNAWSRNADDEHGYLIPFVVLGLLWRNREELVAVPKRVWWPALGLVVGALGLHVVGFQVQQPRLSVVAFFLGLYALSGLVWGPAWLRATFFPVFLFAFCVPLGSLAERVSFPLRVLATDITVLVAKGPLGIDVIQNGTSIFDPAGKFSYEIAAACSGLRSLTAVLALACIFGFVWFRPWWKRGVLILAAFPLAVLCNVFRLSSIIVAAEAFGQTAGNTIHDSQLFSLLPYLPALAGLALLGWWIGDRTAETDAKAGDPGVNDQSPMTKDQ